MLTVVELMERAKARASIPSNYRLARVLGVTEVTVGNWKHGRKVPDDATTIRLADLAGIDQGEALASMHAARATDAGIAAAWRRVAERAAATAAAAILSAGLTGAPDAQARAGTGQGTKAPTDTAHLTRYTLSRLRSALRRTRRDLCTLASGVIPHTIAAPCCT